MEFSEEGLDDFLKELKVKSQAPIVPQGQISKREYKRILHRNIANKVQTQMETPMEVEPPQKKADTSSKSKEAPSLASLSQKLQIQTAEAKRNKSPSPEGVEVQFNSSQEKKEILKIFQSKAFVFIPFGFVFTKKQIDILSENIRKRGGKTFEFSFFDWKPLSFFDLMIITSNQMPHKVLLETVTENHHKCLDDFTFVDFGWIAKCIQENSLLDHSAHVIQWVQEIEVEKPVKKPARDIYATYNQLRGGNNNKRLKRNVGDTEALELYLEEEKLELEALALESELIRYPIKKMKKNLQVLETCRFLYDYSVGGQLRLVTYEDYQIKEVHRELPKDSPKKSSPQKIVSVKSSPASKDEPELGQLTVPVQEEPSSPRTEILSVSDTEPAEDLDSEVKDYTKTLTFTQKMEVEEGETQAMSVFGAKVSPDFKVFEEFDESLMPKQEFLPNHFVLDSDDDEEDDDSDFQFLQPIKSDKEAVNVSKVKNYNDPMLKGVEVQDEEERVKLYKTFNPLTKGKAKYWDNKKSFFVCETGTIANHNVNITTELEKLQKVYTNEKDMGRIFAYRKALAIIRTVPFKIESPEDINNITGIGKKIKEKIQEIVSTGKLKKAEILTKDIKQITIETLSQVWGIGVQTAIELFQKGLRTIDDLRRNTDLLNDNQKVGLKYFDDLKKRMTREEVTEIVKIVEAKIEELADDKHLFEVICCGSYRRGKPTCGDIDILITRRDGKPFAGFLQKLIKSLEGNLLTDHLMWPKPGTYGNETYMGICKNGGLHRRIDIKIYPREQFGYAVLYFTGNDYFNRSMRLFARKKGLTLSDHGLYPSIRNKQEKVWTGQNIPCMTEEEVFTVLGLTYRPPTEREV